MELSRARSNQTSGVQKGAVGKTWAVSWGGKSRGMGRARGGGGGRTAGHLRGKKKQKLVLCRREGRNALRATGEHT